MRPNPTFLRLTTVIPACLCLLGAGVAGAQDDAAAPAQEASAAKTPLVIEEGRMVGIEYTLTLQDGTQVDSNVGGEPLEYRQGSQQIIPGLEEALAGLQIGSSKKVTVQPEKAYGPVREDAFEEVAIEEIPEDARKAGALLVAEGENGQRMRVRVHEVKDKTIILDFNHPLAGETLTFDVKILSIE